MIIANGDVYAKVLGFRIVLLELTNTKENIMSSKEKAKFFLNKPFVQNFMAIAGAGAGFSTISLHYPYASEVWLNILVGMLLSIANICFWSLVLSRGSSDSVSKAS